MRPAARGGEAASRGPLADAAPGVLPLHADAGHSAEGLTPSRSKFLRALNDYRRLCLWQSCPRHRLWPEWSSGCPGSLGSGAGPLPCTAEKLASSCRALYEEADPSAFWQRLDQLDAAMNNYSLILLLEYRGTRILLPGDTNHMGYGGLAPASLRADLFKVGHHGQRDGISAEQIQAIAPRAVVCCASSDRPLSTAPIRPSCR